MLRYPSIENSYRQKHIDYWLEHYDGLKDADFIIQEKLHGANFQMEFIPGEEVKFYSRNQLITDNFHGFAEILEDFEVVDLIQNIEAFAEKSGKTLNLFGELIGPGVGKGVYYGDKKTFRYFDLYIDGELQTQLFTQNILMLHDTLSAPILTTLDGEPVLYSLEDALRFNVEGVDSGVTTKEDNTWEGIVIKPWDKTFVSPEGSVFYLKKKSEKFEEKVKEKKVIVEDPTVKQFNNVFQTYINKNRVESAFSKMGEIQTPNQMGKYIQAILEDAKEDFLKDVALPADLTPAQRKQIFNVGSTIANLLKVYL